MPSTKRKRTPLVSFFFWRKAWDSNPRGLSPKRFSRPPRYDRFDSLPSMLTLIQSKQLYLIFAGDASLCPVAVPEICCSLFASPNFDRCHSFLLAFSATGSARKRPRFDSLPNMLTLIQSKQLYLIFAGDASLCPVAVPEICCSLFASPNFDRCHSFLLAFSATGSARKRPRFDSLPNIWSAFSNAPLY